LSGWVTGRSGKSADEDVGAPGNANVLVGLGMKRRLGGADFQIDENMAAEQADCLRPCGMRVAMI
jgi:hypothetical protein